MTKIDHLLTITAEECSEVLFSESNEEFEKELADLIGVIELLKEEDDFEYRCYESEVEITKEDLERTIKTLQYFMFKSLRFGLEDANPKTSIPNIEEISLAFHFVERFGSNLNLEELIEKKKEKVKLFLEYSKKQGRLV